MIEVELRGFLNKSSAKKFKKYLDSNCDKSESYQEVAMFFDTANIPTLGNFYKGVGRIQANQKKYENGDVSQKIKLKLNEPSSDGRVEYELVLNNNGLPGFFEILNRFGVTRAVFKKCKRYDYSLKNIEVSLKFDHPIGDHFEAEIQCDSEEKVEKTKNNLLKFLSKFDLEVWSSQKYKDVITVTAYKTPYISYEEGRKLL